MHYVTTSVHDKNTLMIFMIMGDYKQDFKDIFYGGNGIIYQAIAHV